MYSAVVIGGRGLLGSALSKELLRLQHLNPQYDLAMTTRDPNPSGRYCYLNLSNEYPRLPVIFKGGVVFLVAAVTSLGAAESQPDAWRINADAPAALALQAVKEQMFPVFVSSDAVEKFPHMAYSKQKAYAETIVLGCGGAVVRPTRIPPERVGGLVQSLVTVGEYRGAGLHRWQP